MNYVSKIGLKHTDNGKPLWGNWPHSCPPNFKVNNNSNKTTITMTIWVIVWFRCYEMVWPWLSHASMLPGIHSSFTPLGAWAWRLIRTAFLPNLWIWNPLSNTKEVDKKMEELVSWSAEQTLDSVHHTALYLRGSRKAPEGDGRTSSLGSVFTQQGACPGREVTEHRGTPIH